MAANLQAYVQTTFDAGAVFDIKQGLESSITSRVQSINGEISQIKQTANSIVSSVSDVSGRISSVEQNIEGVIVNGKLTATTLQTAKSGQRIEASGTEMKIYGNGSYPNIVFGIVNGYATLRYYDNNGVLLYDLGPDGFTKSASQDEKFSGMYDYYALEPNNGADYIDDTNIKSLYYIWKGTLASNWTSKLGYSNSSYTVYKYEAKINGGQFQPGNYCASASDAQRYNNKVFAYGYSAKLTSSMLFSGLICPKNYGVRVLGTYYDDVYDWYQNPSDYFDDGVFNNYEFEFVPYGSGSTNRYYLDRVGNNVTLAYTRNELRNWKNLLVVEDYDGKLVDPIMYIDVVYYENGEWHSSPTFFINQSKLLYAALDNLSTTDRPQHVSPSVYG